MKTKYISSVIIIIVLTLIHILWAACMYHYCSVINWGNSLITWLPILLAYLLINRKFWKECETNTVLTICVSTILTVFILAIFSYVFPAGKYANTIFIFYIKGIILKQVSVVLVIESLRFLIKKNIALPKVISNHSRISIFLFGFIASFILLLSEMFVWFSGFAVIGLHLDRFASDILGYYFEQNALNLFTRFCFSILFGSFIYLLFHKSLHLKILGIFLYGILLIYNYLVFRHFT